MKNLFEIDNNEIKRILSLHEESTKKQYLNVLNETLGGDDDYSEDEDYHASTQSTDPLSSYETTSKAYSLENANNINSRELELYKGTKFVKKQSNKYIYLTTQQVLVGFPGDLGQVGASPKAKGHVIYWCSGSYAGKYQFKLISGNPNLSVNLDTETWYDEKGDLSPLLNRVCKSELPKTVTTPKDDKKKSKTQLTDTEKKRKAKKMGWNDWKSYEESGWKLNPKKVFATQTTDLTKQIQTSLGNTSPTGSITDADLDLILTQLKQS